MKGIVKWANEPPCDPKVQVRLPEGGGGGLDGSGVPLASDSGLIPEGGLPLAATWRNPLSACCRVAAGCRDVQEVWCVWGGVSISEAISNMFFDIKAKAENMTETMERIAPASSGRFSRPKGDCC